MPSLSLTMWMLVAMAGGVVTGLLMPELAKELGVVTAIFLRLMWGVPDKALRREYRKRMWRVLKRRPEPIILRLYALKCAIHYHLHAMIWHRHVDHAHEGGLRLGLWENKPGMISEPGRMRPIHDLFKKAGTPAWDEAAKFALAMTGLKSWDELAR